MQRKQGGNGRRDPRLQPGLITQKLVNGLQVVLPCTVLLGHRLVITYSLEVMDRYVGLDYVEAM